MIYEEIIYTNVSNVLRSTNKPGRSEVTAHQANDRAVMRAYGLTITTSESDTVAHLFRMYEQLAK